MVINLKFSINPLSNESIIFQLKNNTHATTPLFEGEICEHKTLTSLKKSKVEVKVE